MRNDLGISMLLSGEKEKLLSHVSGPGAPHASDAHRGSTLGSSRASIRRVCNTKHSLGAMSRDVAVEENRVGIVDDLVDCTRVIC